MVRRLAQIKTESIGDVISMQSPVFESLIIPIDNSMYTFHTLHFFPLFELFLIR